MKIRFLWWLKEYLCHQTVSEVEKMNFVLYTYFIILTLEQKSFFIYLFIFLKEVYQIECVVLWCYVSCGGLCINGQLILFSTGDACLRLQSQVISEQTQGTFQLFSTSINIFKYRGSINRGWVMVAQGDRPLQNRHV